MSDPIRLIFVDDDGDYREAATGELTDLGFTVESFGDGASMLEAMAGGLEADVIVLDWGLPAVTGIDLLPRLRRQGIMLPVVFLTGRATPAHEHLAFDRGALDFVDKARGVPILAKRIRLIATPIKQPPEIAVEESMHCGKLMLKPRVSRAFWNDQDVNLTLTEFNIVRLLASNVGNHVTYRAVYDCMHHVGFIAGSGEHGYRTNVRSSIKRIRNKFRAVDNEFGEIENYPSFGYRWGRDPAAATELVGDAPETDRLPDA
jgi:two-component system, OmpR family, response regulator ChvI